MTGSSTSVCGCLTYDDDPFDFSKPITEAVVLTAQWIPETHAVSFDANGGSKAPASQTVEHGKTAIEPGMDPAREGFAFTGWYTDAACSDDKYFDFETAITDDLALHAGWVQAEQAGKHTVSFNLNGGTGTAPLQEVEYGSTATAPAPAPTKDHYFFTGWYADEQCGPDSSFVFTTRITRDTVLYARWLPESCTVSFDVDGGAPQPDNQAVAYGALVEKPANDPEKSGFDFKGWWELEEQGIDGETANEIRYGSDFDDIYWVDDDNNLFVPFNFAEDAVYGNMTLHARWQPKVNTVSFVDDSGNVIGEQKVLSGNAPTIIDGGSDDWYAFEGWFADEARSVEYDFSQPVNADATVYGKWTEQTYTVSFDSNGGSAVSPQSQQVPFEGSHRSPTIPSGTALRSSDGTKTSLAS